MEEAAGTSKESTADSVTYQPQEPLKESLVQILLTLGFTREEATEALLCTGNNDADVAASWILENRESMQTARVLDEEFECDMFEYAEICKMVVVVNGELNMGRGKIAAQVAHASLGVYKEMTQTLDKYGKMLFTWQQYGETIIVVKVDKTSAILELKERAETLSLPCYLVHDAGLTQTQCPGSLKSVVNLGRNPDYLRGSPLLWREVDANASTALAILGKISELDQITGHLQLL